MKTRVASVSDAREPHGVTGQLNIYLLDIGSDITGHGKHNRVLVSQDQHDQTIIAREDRSGLPLSTDVQRRKVMNGWQRMHKVGVKLVHVRSTQHRGGLGGESIEHAYKASTEVNPLRSF